MLATTRSKWMIALAAGTSLSTGCAKPPAVRPADAELPGGAPRVVPLERAGRYVFEANGLSLEVDPSHGGRITSFAIDRSEVLSGRDVDPENYGSTFWTSPQSEWDWPPPAAIDSAPYQATVERGILILTSPPSPELGVRVVKRFQLDARDRAIDIEYLVWNLSDRARKLAPWEITRVAVNGVTLFPTGERTYGSGTFAPLSLVRRSGAWTWFAFDPRETREQELFADGAGGWLARAAEGVVFVKTFVDVPAARQAPGEGEIELFVHPDALPNKRYLELEVQGPYAAIPPGGSSAWRTRWYLAKSPPRVRAVPFDAGLTDFVEGLVSSRGR
jgi:Domain of unknown function (DUF4380)